MVKAYSGRRRAAFAKNRVNGKFVKSKESDVTTYISQPFLVN